MSAVALDDFVARHQRDEAVVAATRAQFNAVNKEQVVTASVGDRLIAMTLTGDLDALEVIMVRKNGVVARALTGLHFEKGAKYTMPTQYDGQFPKMVGMHQVSLYTKQQAQPVAKPKRAPVARANPGESKLDKCKQLYADAADKSKAAITKLFVEQGGCTEKGAVTYFYLCKKG